MADDLQPVPRQDLNLNPIEWRQWFERLRISVNRTISDFTGIDIADHLNNDDIHFEVGDISHQAISGAGAYTHALIDSHIDNAGLHFSKASISHTEISDIGTNSHATLDSHLADTSIHFTKASLQHDLITGSGSNSHAVIDTHLANLDIHFTKDSLSHTEIADIGTFTHAQIDSHISDTSFHFTMAGIDHGSISGLTDDDHTQYHNDARALTWLGTRSTTDLSEGTNLYFTSARVEAIVTAAFVGTLGVDHGSLSGMGDDDHPQYFLADGTRAVTGLASFNADLEVASRVYHQGDSDTYLHFNADEAYLACGGTRFWLASESTQDALTLNPDGNNIDLVFKGNAKDIFSYDYSLDSLTLNPGSLTLGAYSIPVTDGTSGQALQTNGAGSVTWQTLSANGWTVGLDYVYPAGTEDRVVIGATSESTDYTPSDLITNGDFATDTDWTKGTGWTITGGVADFDSTGQSADSDLEQTISGLTIGDDYRVTFDLTFDGGSTGKLQVLIDSTDISNGGIDASGGFPETDGTYAFNFKATATSHTLKFRAVDATNDFDGTIDNVVFAQDLKFGGKKPKIDIKIDNVNSFQEFVRMSTRGVTASSGLKRMGFEFHFDNPSSGGTSFDKTVQFYAESTDKFANSVDAVIATDQKERMRISEEGNFTYYGSSFDYGSSVNIDYNNVSWTPTALTATLNSATWTTDEFQVYYTGSASDPAVKIRDTSTTSDTEALGFYTNDNRFLKVRMPTYGDLASPFVLHTNNALSFRIDSTIAGLVNNVAQLEWYQQAYFNANRDSHDFQVYRDTTGDLIHADSSLDRVEIYNLLPEGNLDLSNATLTSDLDLVDNALVIGQYASHNYSDHTGTTPEIIDLMLTPNINVLAFTQSGVTVERGDGVGGWTDITGTIGNDVYNLFDEQGNTVSAFSTSNVTPYTGTTIEFRITTSMDTFRAGAMLQVAQEFNNGWRTYTCTVESWDGATWTQRAQWTNNGTVWSRAFADSDMGGDSQIRFTFDCDVGTDNLSLRMLRAVSYRASAHSDDKMLFNYSWDRRVGLNTDVDTAKTFRIKGHTSDSTESAFYVNDSSNVAILNARNDRRVAIGNGTPDNAALTVYGLTTGSSDYIFRARNSSSITKFVVRDDGFMGFNTASFDGTYEFNFAGGIKTSGNIDTQTLFGVTGTFSGNISSVNADFSGQVDLDTEGQALRIRGDAGGYNTMSSVTSEIGNASFNDFKIETTFDDFLIQCGTNDSNKRSFVVRSGDTVYGLAMDTAGRVEIGSSAPSGTEKFAVNGTSRFDDIVSITENTSSPQLTITGGTGFGGNPARTRLRGYSVSQYGSLGVIEGYNYGATSAQVVADITAIRGESDLDVGGWKFRATNNTGALKEIVTFWGNNDGSNHFDFVLNNEGADLDIKFKSSTGTAYSFDNGLNYHLWTGAWESDQFKYQSSLTGAIECFFVGDRAGEDGLNTGQGNYFIGTGAGKRNTSGSHNLFFGHASGNNNTTGIRNVGIGYYSLLSNVSGSRNVAIGYRVLQSSTGDQNVGIGSQALTSITTGFENVAIGAQALTNATTGYQNFCLGANALESVVSGYGNVAIGTSALRNSHTKNRTVAIGYLTGQNANTGTSVLLGPYAGDSETADEKLHIANNASESLIEGDFANKWVKIQGLFEADAVNETITTTSTSETVSVSTCTYIRQTASGITTSLSNMATGRKITIKNATSAQNTLNITIDGTASPKLNAKQAVTIVYNGTDWDSV